MGDPFGKDEKLPAPFGTGKTRKSGDKQPTYNVFVGEDDLGPNLRGVGPSRGPEGGMLIGPDHPIFDRPHNCPDTLRPFGVLPPDAAPPGARFDPITPIAPYGDRHSIPSGEPDPDELLPPGIPGDPLNPSAHPHRNRSAPNPSNLHPPGTNTFGSGFFGGGGPGPLI